MRGALPVSAALVAGALVSGSVPIPGLSSLSTPARAAAALALGLVPLLLGRWRGALACFVVWLMVEDLARKLSGNDLRVYAFKDVLFLLVLVGLVVDPRARGAWSEATGTARVYLYLLVAWAIVMSLPTLLEDWRLPLVALRLDFLYVPLVIPGYLIARERGRLDRWLLGLAVLGALVSASALAQATLGPQLFNPGESPTGLPNLDLVRGVEGSGPILIPSGPFVDPGRMSAASVMFLAIAVAAFSLSRGWRRGIAGVSIGMVAAAVWISGGRAALVMGAGVILLGTLGSRRLRRRWESNRSGALVTTALFVSLVALGVLNPTGFLSRLAWYQETLSPISRSSEWASRWSAYGGDTVRGLRVGGLIGQGTGTESLGKQYLYAGGRSSVGLYQVEGGYASVAVEWGAIGLLLWLGWSLAWVRRQWLALRACPSESERLAGAAAFAWVVLVLLFHFFAGLQVYQNFVTNAFLWLLSGMVFGLRPSTPPVHDRPAGRSSR